MPQTLEELLSSLPRTFYAKLRRISEECKTEPRIVLNEGIDLFRRYYRILAGPTGARISTLQEAQDYSMIKRQEGLASAEKWGKNPQARTDRAKAGAAARKRSLAKRAKS